MVFVHVLFITGYAREELWRALWISETSWRDKKYRRRKLSFTEDKGSTLHIFTVKHPGYAKTSSFIVTISLTATEFVMSYWGAKYPAKNGFKCSVFPSPPECSSSCSRSIGISIACFRCRWWNSTPITLYSPDGRRRAGTLTAVASDLMTQLTALRWIRRHSLNRVCTRHVSSVLIEFSIKNVQ